MPESEQAATVAIKEAEPLDDRLLFHVLSAELAGNQGDLRQSQQAYLDAARLSSDPRIIERAARLALYLHDHSATMEAGRRWLTLEPDDPAPHEVLALTLLRNDRFAEALDHLRTALGLQLGGAGSGFERIVALLGQETGNSKTLALEALETLVAEHSAEPQAHQALAELALQFERPELALPAAERARALAPEWTAPDLLMVQAYLRMDQGEKAVELLERVLRRQPDDYDLRLQYARTLLGLERAEGALQQFELLLQARPNAAQIRYVVALLALELGESDKARDYFLQLVNSGQRSDDAYFYLGRLAQAEGDAKGALRWYRRVQGQHRPDALLQLAVVLAQQGQQGAAQAKLKEVRQQYPAYAPNSYLVEAGQLRNQGRTQDALALYAEALEQHPDDVDLRYGYGLTAAMLGRVDIAEQSLRRLLDQQPDEPIFLNALGYTLVDQTDRYQEGYELVERAYALSPDNPAIMDSMGWALYRLQRLDEALEILLQAYELHQDGEIAAHLAEVLWHAGDRREARRILAEGLKREPGHKVLLETRKRLR